MALFENFPYTNFHELNLDWIVKTVLNFDQKLDRVIAGKIKVADPLQWDITNQYEEFTIVYNQGKAYISLQPVPVGLGLNNAEYWLQLFDIDALFDSFKDAVSFHDDGVSITSTENRAVNSLVWLNDKLYKVIAPINISDAYSAENVSLISIEEWVDAFVTALNNAITAANTQINSLANQVNGILPITPDKLASKKYVFVTDSYGSYSDESGKSFIQLACSYAGIPSTDYYIAQRGSAGFFRPDNTNFLEVFKSIESNINDPAAITDIFVFGGANDQVASSAAQIESGISAFCSYIKAHYTNAQIYIGFVTRTLAGSFNYYYPRTLKAYTECARYGAHYLSGSECIMSDNQLYNPDHVHPKQTTVPHIARYCADLILSHTCTVQFEPYYNSCFAIDENNNINGSIFQDNSVLTYNHGSSILGSMNGGIGLILDCSIPTLSQNLSVTGLKLTKAFNPPIHLYASSIPVPVTLTHSGGQTTVQGFFSLLRDPNADGSYTIALIIYPEATFTNVTRMTLGIHMSMNT